MNQNFCIQASSSWIKQVDFFSDNSDSFVCADDHDNISLFLTKTKEIVWTNKINDCYFFGSINVSPDKKIVAFGGRKKYLVLIDAASGETLGSIYVDHWILRVLFFSKQKIACGLENGTVAIVCCQSLKMDKKMKICTGTVHALAISPVKNDILLTGDDQGVITQTIISLEKSVMVYEGHVQSVMDLKFLSCGTMFVSGSHDCTSRLFALDQKQAIRIFQGHFSNVRSICPIFDDELLITVSWDNSLKVWQMDDGVCLSTVTVLEKIWCVSFSKDEKSVIIGDDDGKVTIFSCPPQFAVSLDRNLKLCC